MHLPKLTKPEIMIYFKLKLKKTKKNFKIMIIIIKSIIKNNLKKVK
jgi:hypothetical protein